MTFDHEHDSSVDIDNDIPEYDESQGRHRAYCRGCGEIKYDCSNDDGYCGDCN